MNGLFSKIVASTKALPASIRINSNISNSKKRKILEGLLLPAGFFRYAVHNKKVKYRPKNVDMCVIIKNESPYIVEWIKYHELLGIENFYIFNNDSTDNIDKVLKPFVDKGNVQLYNLPGKVRQLDAYNIGLRLARKNGNYLLVLDADEFLFLRDESDDITEIVNQFFKRNESVGGLVFNWCIYGSSHFEEKQTGLVTQIYTHRSHFDFENNKNVKSLVDPDRTVAFTNPHFATYYGNYHAFNLQGNVVEGPFSKPVNNPRVRINHYFTKSKEEFLAKRSRGMADSVGIRDVQDFETHDRNEVFDDSMKRYADLLK